MRTTTSGGLFPQKYANGGIAEKLEKLADAAIEKLEQHGQYFPDPIPRNVKTSKDTLIKHILTGRFDPPSKEELYAKTSGTSSTTSGLKNITSKSKPSKYASGGRVSPTSDVKGTRGMRPLVNDLDPSRPPPRGRPVTDPLEKALLAMEDQEPIDSGLENQPAGGVVDFEYIKKLAKSMGVDIGIKLDESLLASVGNDPDKYIEIRSDPAQYNEFKKNMRSASGENASDKDAKQPPKKPATSSSMPASQAQPPRPQR